MKHSPTPKTRREVRCPVCGTAWRTSWCPWCDPGTPLSDRLVLARLRAEEALGGPVAAGLDPAVLAALELGRRVPTREELAALARVYGVAAGVFLRAKP